MEAEDLGGAVVTELTGVTARQEGQYSCVLTNTRGEGRPSELTTVRVVRLPRVRLEVVGGQTEKVVVVERSPSLSPTNISLSCRLQGERQVRHQHLQSVHWYLDNILLHTLPHCPSSHLCHVDPTQLLLENVNRHFHGNFSCAGSLSGGLTSQMSNSVPVTVLHPPGPASLTVSPGAVLYSGDRVTFTCSLATQGRPVTQGYRWRLGGREVEQENSARLTLTVTDSGGEKNNVSCHGYNQAGPGEAGWLNISVMTGPSLALSLPPRTPVREDQLVQLVCQVVCRPGCELRWYREGRLIRDSALLGFSVNRTISYQNKRKYYR